MPSLDRQRVGGRTRLRIIFLSLPTSLALAVGTALPGVFLGKAHGTAKAALTAALVVSVLLSALSAWLRHHRSGGYRHYASRLARAVTGAGQPVIIALGELGLARTREERDRKLDLLQERVLQTTLRMCGSGDADRNRAVLYLLDPGGDRLKYVDHAGRQEHPRKEFLKSDIPFGRAVVEFASRENPEPMDLVADVFKDRLRGSVDAQRVTYRSYVAVPVAIGTTGYGILSVDSPESGHFTLTDAGTLQLLAGVLASGLAQHGEFV
ncbi:hypothetical protein ACSNOI_33680 [Actinomadura kijaniata]|uniref:hypothetical protein n=1 Tax=Actinomadura kijaniata TaxID=46161 RepID=UPI003F1A8D68